MPNALLWHLYVKVLPRERKLRAELRRINRIYEPWVDEAKGEERESRIAEYMHERDEVLEQLELLATERLRRRAAKYPTAVIPRITMTDKDHLDKNWERGPATGRWYLRRAAYASLYREIEDAEKRRREVWESRIKILGTVLPWLVALVSALVSLVLAWPWRSN
jgi:hypothetical protein